VHFGGNTGAETKVISEGNDMKPGRLRLFRVLDSLLGTAAKSLSNQTCRLISVVASKYPFTFSILAVISFSSGASRKRINNIYSKKIS